MTEQCIKNVIRSTNIVSETTWDSVTVQTHRDFCKTLMQGDETFNKAAARLKN